MTAFLGVVGGLLRPSFSLRRRGYRRHDLDPPYGALVVRTVFQIGLDGMGRAARRWHHRRCNRTMERLMPQPNDLSRSLVALGQGSTLVAVIEMGQASWLVAGVVPGVNRHPLKKIAADQD